MVKSIKKHMVIFQEFLVRKLTRTGVQVAKIQVQLASNFKKTEKKTRKTYATRPKPTDLMDSDHTDTPEALD